MIRPSTVRIYLACALIRVGREVHDLGARLLKDRTFYEELDAARDFGRREAV